MLSFKHHPVGADIRRVMSASTNSLPERRPNSAAWIDWAATVAFSLFAVSFGWWLGARGADAPADAPAGTTGSQAIIMCATDDIVQCEESIYDRLDKQREREARAWLKREVEAGPWTGV